MSNRQAGGVGVPSVVNLLEQAWPTVIGTVYPYHHELDGDLKAVANRVLSSGPIKQLEEGQCTLRSAMLKDEIYSWTEPYFCGMFRQALGIIHAECK